MVHQGRIRESYKTMTPSTHPVVDPVLAVLLCVFLLAVALACQGCTIPRGGQPCYALVNLAPSVQIGGSKTEAYVQVENRQDGDGNIIEKRNPLETHADGSASIPLRFTPAP